MTESSGRLAVLSDTQRSLLLSITGRQDLVDALQWIAEGRPTGTVAVHELLGALVVAVDADLPSSEAALRSAARRALTSAVDTSADLLQTESILHPRAYDDALATVAACTPTGTLVGITAGALAAALNDHPNVVEVIGQVAGLAWRDLRDRASSRGVTLPSAATGPWQMSQLTVVLDIVDQVVQGTATARIPGGVPARPLELLLGSGPVVGWEAAELLRAHGVSYGLLLAQRDVGGSWGAHRNRTNNEVSRIVTTQLLAALVDAGVTYWSTAGTQSERVPKRFLATQAARTGNTPGQLTVVTRGDDGSPRLAIFLATARDGGTARKTGSTLLKIPPLLKIPAAVVLVGPGWADRGESDDLIRAFGGRVFTDETLGDLVGLGARSASLSDPTATMHPGGPGPRSE